MKTDIVLPRSLSGRRWQFSDESHEIPRSRREQLQRRLLGIDAKITAPVPMPRQNVIRLIEHRFAKTIQFRV